MATRSSLGTISTPSTLAISNGTLQIEGNTVTAINLSANTTLKTNSERHIISANLVKADIKDLGDILTNPLTVDLDADGKNITNVGNIETTLLNNRGVLYNPSITNLNMNNFNINNTTNINTTTLNNLTPAYNTPLINLDMNGKDIENVGNIETTLLNSRGVLYNPSIANLNMAGFNINNSPTITTLQDKTQYITADTKTGETVFNSSILLNGGNITNMNSILFDNGSTIVADNQNLLLTSNNLITTTASIDTDFDIRCGTLTAVDISNSTFSNLINKTQYQSVVTASQTTRFDGIVNATTTLSVGVAQSGQTGYNFPLTRPLVAGYVLTTPSSTGNTLQFQVAADASKIQNITAVPNLTTFTGSTRVLSNTTVDGLSTLVGGITSNTKITLTKNIIEIQEDNVQTQAITIGNLLTTGYALPRTTNGIAGSDLRLLSDGNLSFYSPGSIRAYRVDTVPDATTLTFNFANTLVNLSGSLSTQNIVGDFSWQATGAQYTGAITRPFNANFSIILLNENKDIVPIITLTLATIGGIDHSTQVFEHTHNRTRQWILMATGVVSQNQIITARIKSTLAGGASTTICSPQLNITLL